MLTTFILLLILFSGCNRFHNVPVWKHGIFERPAGDKEYPPIYIKGWQHGCESGAQASANFLFRFKYKYKQDWKLLSNNLYSQGWNDAYNFCRKYILQHNTKTFD